MFTLGRVCVPPFFQDPNNSQAYVDATGSCTICASGQVWDDSVGICRVLAVPATTSVFGGLDMGTLMFLSLGLVMLLGMRR